MLKSVISALLLANTALAADPWYVTKRASAVVDYGAQTLFVDAQNPSCYYDRDWNQLSVDFVSRTLPSNLNLPYTTWTLLESTTTDCGARLPQLEAELADSKLDVRLKVTTHFIATYYNDGNCHFNVIEIADAVVPSVGTFSANRILTELQLTTEACKQAFANWN